MRKRHTSEERERLIAEVKATGETARAVAERMGICASSAYRWMKDTADPGAPVFARVVQSRAVPRSALTVQVGRVAIRVETGFDADLLRGIVTALGDPT